MNEKIKQLATESKLMSIIEELDLEIINAHDVSRVEKFAELIVKECAELAKLHVMNISTYADAEFVDQQIKEHFGVEE